MRKIILMYPLYKKHLEINEEIAFLNAEEIGQR